MNLHFYKEDDVQCPDMPFIIDGKQYPFTFIADVTGDNPEALSDYDNHILADKLTRFGALGAHDRLDCESCCFYAYFRNRSEGVKFLKKLNAYISQKSRLLREASVF